MAIYQLIKPRELLMTMKFNSYNAAVAFAQKSGILNPSKPYKRVMHVQGELKILWCVTLPSNTNRPAQNAEYRRVA